MHCTFLKRYSIFITNKSVIMLKTVCGYVGLVWFNLVWFGEICFGLAYVFGFLAALGFCFP